MSYIFIVLLAKLVIISIGSLLAIRILLRVQTVFLLFACVIIFSFYVAIIVNILLYLNILYIATDILWHVIVFGIVEIMPYVLLCILLIIVLWKQEYKIK